jgi:uncharacterized surface protein with fasciclin (FAS1) repeats
MKILSAILAAVAVTAAPFALANDCPGKAAGRGASAAMIPASQSQTQGDIVDIAASAGTFKTLVAAVQAAGLVETLRGQGPFTVFAPTDEAFRALPAGTVERLLRPENRGELTRILTYHVVPGRVTSDQLAGRTARPATVQGQKLRVDGRQGVSVDQARVIRADIAASNGVVHVIDRVLIPPAH